MPIPKFNFEDADAGLPQHPVPVRLACLAADWSPALFAVVVSGDANLGPPLLAVWEYEENNGHFGQVHARAYVDLIPPDATLPEAIAALPENHFVWSDDLRTAFSDLIDLTIGRDAAHADNLAIIWDPAHKGCDLLVAQCPDFSKLLSSPQEICFLRKSGGAWMASCPVSLQYCLTSKRQDRADQIHSVEPERASE